MDKNDKGAWNMKRWMVGLWMLFALPVAAGACGIGEQTAEGYENVPVQHVYQHWKQGERSPIPFIVLDVRTPQEFAAGHIEGARLIPVQDLERHLKALPKDRQIYVYCRSGRRSARAAKMLATHGFDRVENMLGGIEAWKAAGYPVVH